MKQKRVGGLLNVLLAIGCMALSYTAPARADCVTTGGTQLGGPITISLQRDEPNGQINFTRSFSELSRFSCTSSGITEQQFGIEGNAANITGETSSGRMIYKLGDSGIGYIVYGQVSASAFCIGSAYIGTGPLIGGDSNTAALCSASSGYITPQPLNGAAILYFFKIGPVTPGVIPASPVASFINVINGGEQTLPAVQLNTGAITVIVNSCSVTSTAITVPMGDVERAAFTAIGSATVPKDFVIPLDCNLGTNINVQFDGISAGGSANVLALNPSSSPPAATGVGVQVLFDGNPITLGAPIAVGTTSAEGPYDIPLQARYYQTDSTITPGLANSTATFTLTYQ